MSPSSRTHGLGRGHHGDAWMQWDKPTTSCVVGQRFYQWNGIFGRMFSCAPRQVSGIQPGYGHAVWVRPFSLHRPGFGGRRGAASLALRCWFKLSCDVYVQTRRNKTASSDCPETRRRCQIYVTLYNCKQPRGCSNRRHLVLL